MRTPWKSLRPSDPGREYLALLSYLPLKHFRTVPRLVWYVFRIVRQLRGARGLIAYSLEAKPLRLQFWTLSAWEGEDALQEFVGQLAHRASMQALTPDMGATDFLRWRVRGSELPLTWEMARNRERERIKSPAG
jgi:hypothetical protein